jgi:hypothetical protein
VNYYQTYRHMAEWKTPTILLIFSFLFMNYFIVHDQAHSVF